MPDEREYQSVVEEAEQAAGAGDFARANLRLRAALQIQESTLGTAHPDLASTLNNLAVVCETVGEIDDAERFYRRAYAIASGSLPPGDPLVATSRDNLKDFCASRGRPFEEGPGMARPARPSRSAVAVTPPASAWPTRILAVLAALAVVGALVAVWSWRTPAPPERAAALTPATSTTAAPPAATAIPAATPAAPADGPPIAPPVPAALPTPMPPPTATSAAPTPPARATAATPEGIRIVAANVCASLSTSGAWRCEAIDAVAAPGRAAFYTRIASPSAMRVQHRWYQGPSLRQSVTLSVAANPSAGYRTFSRQTLSPGAWRVELRAADGTVLHEAAFDVR